MRHSSFLTELQHIGAAKEKNVWITHHRKILLIKWNSRKKKGTKYIVSIKFLYFLNDIGVIYQFNRIKQMDDNINDQNISYMRKRLFLAL